MARIVIVEDHAMFLDSLQRFCAKDLDHEVVGTARDGRTAVAVILRLQPDLVLLEVELPELDGFGVVEAIRHALPRLRIVILSSHCDAYSVYRAERARVQGFVDKAGSTTGALAQALRLVFEGRVWFSQAFLTTKAARHSDAGAFDQVLSGRECEVLGLLGHPIRDDEVAVRLGLSPQTVEKHRFNIPGKLGLQTTTELVRYAQAHGFMLITPPGPRPPAPS
jgi:DNA-binding NarL/FixJ family response regulator